MKRSITSLDVSRAGLGLQPLLYGAKPKRGAIERAMRLLDDMAVQMRRKEIFAAGAAAKKLPTVPKFRGHKLGSSEVSNFYDGFASTHSWFKNPYRGIR
jgi:hypothetical protein